MIFLFLPFFYLQYTELNSPFRTEATYAKRTFTLGRIKHWVYAMFAYLHALWRITYALQYVLRGRGAKKNTQ